MGRPNSGSFESSRIMENPRSPGAAMIPPAPSSFALKALSRNWRPSAVQLAMYCDFPPVFVLADSAASTQAFTRSSKGAGFWFKRL